MSSKFRMAYQPARRPRFTEAARFSIGSFIDVTLELLAVNGATGSLIPFDLISFRH